MRDDAESSHSLRYTRDLVQATSTWIPENVLGVLTDLLEIPEDEGGTTTGEGGEEPEPAEG